MVTLIRPRTTYYAATVEREDLVPGTYWPDSTTAGVLPNVARSTVTSLSVSAGGTYENLNLQYVFTPPAGEAAAPITFRNCKFVGPNNPPAAGDAMAKLFNNQHVPVIFYDCTFGAPTYPHWNWNGISGHHWKAYRCDFDRTTDGLQVFNNNSGYYSADLGCEMLQCYVHDQSFYSNPPDTNHTDGSHSDGLQVQGGANFKFWYNNVQGYVAPEYQPNWYGTTQTNACMQIGEQGSMVISNMDIQFNLFDGGAASLNLSGPFTGASAGIVKNNYFGRGQRRGDNWAINRLASMVCDFGVGTPECNKYLNNGAEVPLHNA